MEHQKARGRANENDQADQAKKHGDVQGSRGAGLVLQYDGVNRVNNGSENIDKVADDGFGAPPFPIVSTDDGDTCNGGKGCEKLGGGETLHVGVGADGEREETGEGGDGRGGGDGGHDEADSEDPVGEEEQRGHDKGDMQDLAGIEWNDGIRARRRAIGRSGGIIRKSMIAADGGVFGMRQWDKVMGRSRRKVEGGTPGFAEETEEAYAEGGEGDVGDEVGLFVGVLVEAGCAGAHGDLD